MRLSDIQGERVFDVIADIIDPIANIAEDDAASGYASESLIYGEKRSLRCSRAIRATSSLSLPPSRA